MHRLIVTTTASTCVGQPKNAAVIAPIYLVDPLEVVARLPGGAQSRSATSLPLDVIIVNYQK